MTGKLQILVASMLLGACGHAAPSPSPESKATVRTPAEDVSPAERLDRLDLRAKVALLPMMANHQKQSMRDHLVAVQEIVAGLSRKDFSVIERASSRMGFSEKMGQMCSHMGEGASGFTDQALRFHHTADTITSAARKRDPEAVLAALTSTLLTCTSCHAAWKQHVVDEQAWQQRSSPSAATSENQGVHQ